MTNKLRAKEVQKILDTHRSSRTAYEPGFMREMAQAFQFDKKLRFHILVGGTNGKGTLVRMLSSILEASGRKTGTFLSPHLLRYNERILINGREIDDQTFLNLYNNIQGELRKVEELAKRKASFFELMLLTAVLFFYQEEVDAAVFEVGLGGERDATACLRPDLSILTHVSYDHTHILGQTLEEIAREKAGVIHRGKKFLWAGDPGLSSFFRQCCRRKQAQFFESKPILNTTIISDIRGTRGQFNFKGSKLTLQTSLRGNYQAENIQTSLQVFELLDRDCTVTAKHCKRGLQSTNHPSRLELLSENPLILVDGSHNAAGIQSLTDWAMRVLPGTQVFFALCIKVNKDHEEISKSLKGFELLLFRPSKGPYLKKKDFEKYYPMGTYVRGYKNLLGYFFSAKPKSKALIVTGSLPIAARVKCFYSKYVKKKARGLDPQA